MAYNHEFDRIEEKYDPLFTEREASVEPLPAGQSMKQSFDTFYAFVQEQIDGLPHKLKQKAKREIILAAEEQFGKVLQQKRARREQRKSRLIAHEQEAKKAKDQAAKKKPEQAAALKRSPA
ncbi:hypothetical protein QR680_000649 [Steinernema hermaphroditum]|uniref:Uncharacterized protein n=1 Tax=Steinernema hermaphroditum TaxID=289476 RepID=A0AA39LDZ0_9BILA|nr:hypothetical protein QR680_000649 [Steinernema hermaphroditum]